MEPQAIEKSERPPGPPPPTGTVVQKLKRRIKGRVERLARILLGKLRVAEVMRAFGWIDQNAYYDRLTEEVMARCIREDSVCVDIGCHAGAMLRHMTRLAPKGYHLAFEPLPGYFARLEEKFQSERVRLFRVALSKEEGTVTFKHVVNRPGHSGLLSRRYPTENEVVEEITVQTRKLDEVIKELALGSVDFIKIDVEGAERWVMEGAKESLSRFKPTILFECGIGAADYYETTPEQVFDLLKECGLQIYNLGDWLHGRKPLAQEEFCRRFNEGRDYFWMAQR